MSSPPEGNRIWRIAHHHGYNTTDYDNAPMGTISLDGNYIYYKTRWENSGNSIEVYQISLPSTWWTDLGGGVRGDML